jgi:Disulphide bond corrector protein DsbC
MKKVIFGFLLGMIVAMNARAQTPCAWTFTAKKGAGGVYEIHCQVDVNAPWHTYSQFTPDGGPVPTKFVFAKNPLYSLDGDTKEEGKMITKHETVFGVDVKYFEGRTDFIQKIKMKSAAKTNVTGTVTFMLCNDQQCLPPATQPFSVAFN